MSTTRYNDKSITEGYVAGIAALIVSILWMFNAPCHPMIIFVPFLIALFCLSLSTLWVFSKEKSIKEWFTSQPFRYFIVGGIEVALIVGFFLVFSLR